MAVAGQAAPQMAFCFLQLKPIFEERRRRAARRLSCIRQRWHRSTSVPVCGPCHSSMRVVLASASEAAAEAAVEATDIVLPPTHRAPIVGGTLEAVGYA